MDRHPATTAQKILMTRGAAHGVAIVTPVYKPSLSRDEEISLHHLENVLGRYERYVLTPPGLPFARRGYKRIELAAEHFASTAAYSRLLLSPAFYELFSANYEHLLIYQLDCLVFRDELADWCEAGYDYIGAPWLGPPTVARGMSARVGNGGFSLRRVAAHLDVLRSVRRPPWHTVWRGDLCPDLRRGRLLKRLRVLRAARRGMAAYAAGYTLNEDHFWSDRARLFAPNFRLAPVDVALRFAFEGTPRSCYARASQIPFGCHAWTRWDRAFWEPHLLTAKDTVSR
jgi:hypothetical protein